ncbi:MAG: hypothetical protein K9M44_00255 [Candidatus Pacebacteria bacterium]|nr:hypothetical protein [Candidatus Paceibacterota bacterium]
MKTTQGKKQKKSAKLENLKKNRNSSCKKKHGGARNNAGRKPKEDNEKVREMKEIIAGHGLEEEEVNGKKVARVAILLTVLFREGAKGNITAIKEYLDRQLGKAKESVEWSNEEGREFKISISTVGDKKDGDKLATNKKAK